ncbi:MAG: glutathione S-transferase family protein [Deltaproteobacteria bacterium]|nr:glutathione S-transferase family protein [Deltaproteobacteria bacterium]
MLTLYDFKSSGNGYKVRLLLHQLRLPFIYVETNILKGESRTPLFLEMNPNGKVPTLALGDGRYLAESNAILLCLAEGTGFIPNDPWQRSKVHEWLFFEQYSHEPNISTPRFWKNYLRVGEYDELELKRRQRAGRDALRVMERHLRENKFFGSQYGVADIALYAYTHKANEAGQAISDFPAIEDWLARVRVQPGHVTMEVV